MNSAQLLKRFLPQLPTQQVQQARYALAQRLEHLLGQSRAQPNDPKSPQEENIRQRIFKQQDHLLTFLDYSQVEATNN